MKQFRDWLINIKNPYIHPILLSSGIILSTLAHNIEVVSPHYVFRPLLSTIIFSTFLIMVLRNVLKDRQKVGVFSTIVLLTLLSYGHIHRKIFKPTIINNPTLLKGIMALLVISGLLIILLLIKRSHLEFIYSTKALNYSSVIFIFLSCIIIAEHELWFLGENPADILPPVDISNMSLSDDSKSNHPDIYYIILDGYPRMDVFNELYGYDNSPFMELLQARGFFVAGNSQSNYGQTTLSLASSLNMRYIDFVVKEVGNESTNQRPLVQLIRRSELRRLLERKGYKFVAFSTGYRRNEINDADIYLEPPIRAITTFETMVLDNSFFVLVQELWSDATGKPLPIGYQAHRDRINFTLNQLGQLPEEEGPKFVFAHLISPHPPFIFGADGEEVQQLGTFQLKDGNEFIGTSDEYIQGLTAQTEFINTKIIILIDEILRRSITPPVIILQADHGPGAFLDWDIPENTNLRERLSIFNAYYIPNATDELLYPSITPVNTFRVIMNYLFNFDYELLPDESYFSSWRQPYKFIKYEGGSFIE
ncbi:MAG: hypothetical protein KAT23_02110 [Anaerolineales bacterium]|nr:hypothetical protein [Anaerolineales bacterium]